MTADDVPARLAFARTVAREAGRQALAWAQDRAGLAMSEKTPGDWVTEADKGVEAFIRRRIGEAFAQDAIVGEEGGSDGPLRGQDGGGAGTWVIDPIDGTLNYVRGLPFWCVCIGFMRGTDFVLGVIEDAVHDVQYFGARGQGAYRQSSDGRRERLQVSGQAGLVHALIGYAHQRKRPVTFSTQAFMNVANAQGAFRALGSGALHLAHVASGSLDGFMESRIQLWDIAAAVPLIL